MPRPVCALALVFLVLLTAMPALAGPRSVHEDFSTTQYRDVYGTTADWDTAAGVIQLPPFAPTVWCSVATPGLARGIAVSGNAVLVADWTQGLQVLGRFSLGPVGNCSTTGKAVKVAVSGGHAFVAGDAAGTDIVDISDLTNPVVIGNYASTGAAQDVAVAGDRVYVADYGYGLEILDISNPASPTHLGVWPHGARGRGLALHGNLILVANEGYGLSLVDVSDPALPTEVGSVDTPGEALDVAVSGNLAYVADGTGGLVVVDITDPTDPVAKRTYSLAGEANAVAVAGTRVLVAGGIRGLYVYDMSDPSSGVLLGVNASTSGTAYDVALYAECAYVADDVEVRKIRTAAYTPPQGRGKASLSGSARDVVVSGRLAYVGDYDLGLQVLNISDPMNPTLVATAPVSGAPRAVAISGDHVFVAAGTTGVVSVDVTDPETPTVLDILDTPGTAMGLFVDGEHLFVADASGGLQIVNVADPGNLSLVGSYTAAGDVLCVHASGNIAYLGLDANYGLEIVDVTSPASPSYLGTAGAGVLQIISSICVAGDQLYLCCDLSGVRRMDLADPTAPVLEPASGGSAFKVLVEGDIVYTVHPGYGRMTILDIDLNPAAIYEPVGGTYYSCAISGDHVVLCGGLISAELVQVWQSESVSSYATARSLDLSGDDDPVVRARLTSTQSDGVTWKLTADGNYSHYYSVSPGDDWYRFPAGSEGSTLRWRTLHTWTAPGDNPWVSEVTVEWLNEYAFIDAVEDVPNDQGRQVSLSWTRSGYDFTGEDSQIVEYAVYRKIDSGLAKSAPRPDFGALSLPARQHATAMATAGWHFLTTVPVRVEDHYAVVVPSLVDSTVAGGMAYSTYMVSALTATPGVFYDSPPDSGYSLDNLAPSPPEGLAYAGGALTWSDPLDADFDYFTVYGSEVEVWDETAVLIGATSETSADVDAHPYGYYHVTATDFSGNEGPAASVLGQVTGVGGGGATQYFLRANSPNPFAATTEIVFSLAEEEPVELTVYDMLGRVVRRLASGVLPAGRHAASWDGRDAQGRPVAAGVYLYRLSAPGYEKTRRMVLLR